MTYRMEIKTRGGNEFHTEVEDEDSFTMAALSAGMGVRFIGADGKVVVIPSQAIDYLTSVLLPEKERMV